MWTRKYMSLKTQCTVLMGAVCGQVRLDPKLESMAKGIPSEGVSGWSPALGKALQLHLVLLNLSVVLFLLSSSPLSWPCPYPSSRPALPSSCQKHLPLPLPWEPWGSQCNHWVHRLPLQQVQLRPSSCWLSSLAKPP